jgi:hypothetical protein
MPSCNLAETVHNKWLQQSGNLGNDLYAATMDDFVRALMHISRYYQYLKGELPGTGPGKEELMLCVAQRSAQRFGNPKVLNAAIAKMPRACSALGSLILKVKKSLDLRSARQMYP